jgi:outer membrane protein assembly factor BamE (lipoprotein component of BamABCDE complex)
MRILMQAALVGMALVGPGCSLLTDKEVLYLQSAENRATQEEVRQRLGRPQLVVPTNTGESVWVYEVRDLEPGSQSTWSTKGSWCDEYVLTFDTDGVLRAWTHKTQFHGGELMPLICVRDGFPRS